jgi:hypothetical protein
VELERRTSARPDATTETSRSHGLTINLEVSVGVGAEVKLLGTGSEVVATAGLEVSFDDSARGGRRPGDALR